MGRPPDARAAAIREDRYHGSLVAFLNIYRGRSAKVEAPPNCDRAASFVGSPRLETLADKRPAGYSRFYRANRVPLCPTGNIVSEVVQQQGFSKDAIAAGFKL